MKPRVYAGFLLWCLALAAPVAAQSGGAPVATETSPPAVKKSAPESDAKKSADAGTTDVGELKGQQEKPPLTAPPAPAPREAGPAVEAGFFQIEFRYVIDGTQLQGNKSRSFLWEGLNNTGESNYIFSRPVHDTWKFENVAAFRYTDNPRVDPERNSLQKAYFRLSGPTFDSYLGDALVNYSRYSFSQNVKGLNFWKDLGHSFRVYGLAGYFADRWGSLYRPASTFRNVLVDCQADSVPANSGTGAPAQPAAGCVETVPGSGTFVLDPNNPLKPYSRFIGGMRLEKKFGRSNWLAVNWSHGNDLLQSLPPAKVVCNNAGVIRVANIYPGCDQPGEVEVQGAREPAAEATLNDVATLDGQWEHQPSRLHVAGEIASSWTAGGTPPAGATPQTFICAAQSPVVGASVLDSRCFSSRKQDMAYRAEGSQRYKKLSWRADYTRFGPDFFSTNARQIRDLQEYIVRGEFEFTRQFTVASSFRRATDNLNGKRNFTNTVRAPEVKFILRELPFYRRLSMEVGYRERNLDTSGNPQPAEERKRSTRIPFFSLSLPAGNNFFSFDYEHRHDTDAVNAPQSTNTDRFAVGYRGNYHTAGWDVSPSVRFEIERLHKNQPNNPALSLTDPSLIFPNDFFIAWDSNRSYQASLLIEAPKYFRVEAYFREFNSVVLVPGTTANPLAGLFYLNQGFKRPNWRGMLTYKIANDENKTISFFYERSNNFFNPGDPTLADTKSFRETVIGGVIFFRFRR